MNNKLIITSLVLATPLLVAGCTSNSSSEELPATDVTTTSSTNSDTNTTTMDTTQFTTTDTGLQYNDTVAGTGDAVKVGDVVQVHYTGTLENGTKFDSSVDRGQPFSFTVGNGMVIAGWEEGLQGMQVGGKRTLIIPAELGYGAQSVGTIPANSTLVFEIELLAIN